MSLEALQQGIDRLAGAERPSREAALPLIGELLDALEGGRVRAAEPAGGDWRVVDWVKRGILLCFRVGVDRASALPPVFHFNDRDTVPALDAVTRFEGLRIVPGGTSVRRGAFLGPGCVVMPPAYVNVGAHVGERTMIDSHVLVGSCAQIGRDVHLSAAAQIGGVLEPVGARPVIVEDRAFVGGGCGLYEGVRVGAGAVLAPGVILTRGTPVHDLVNGRVLRADDAAAPSIPAGAVVVPGSRPAGGEYAQRAGVQLQTPVIVKYRDPDTDASVALEEALR